MSCNDSIPMSDIVAAVAAQLSKQYVAIENGVAKDLTLKGGVTLDSATKQDLCEALENCITDLIASEATTIKSFDLLGEQLRITMSDGSTFTVDTPPAVDNGELVGSELVLKQGNTVIDRINFATLVPQIKADRFLSQVNYNRQGKRLEFVTSAQGEQDQTFTIPLDDLINEDFDIAAYAGDGLEVRGGKIHIKDGLCTLGVTNQSSYTVKDTDDVIVSSGGTITFPSSIPVGRAFTVIQAADTAVVLASDGTINPPWDKTLTMYGKNAVATVIKTGANVFYVSGDMQ